MPTLETPDELADVLADSFGVYGACDDRCPQPLCRPHWTLTMADRIRQSVKNERRLAATADAGEQGGDGG